jgi:hypothetical protein
MTRKPSQEELQAATNATLRAHGTSDEAKALVARLATKVDEHAHAVGLRKHKRNKTAERLEYATGAFLANLYDTISMPHELPELVSVVFEVSDEDTRELQHAAQANLQASAITAEARELTKELAERYPRQGDAKGKHYARIKTKAAYENTNAAFLAELLSAYADERRGRWLRCSLDKDWFKGKRVTYRMFDDVWKSWTDAGLVEFKKGYPGLLAFGNPGPSRGRLTRFKATPKLLQLCAEHGITPDNVTEHFQFEYEMPRELVQLTSPFRRTPTTKRTEKLRSEVAELNEFFAKHTLTHPTIKHIGWVRKFHLAHHPDFKWNKGGRLYSYPPGVNVNYQNVDEDTRLHIEIDRRPVVEIDISSSYLSVFYAWNDQQLDTEQDAYRGILGATDIDRHVAKFWINASFGNSRLLTKWTKTLSDDLRDKLVKKGFEPSAFEPKRYPMKMIKEKVLQRHPLLERWGGIVRGRVRDYGDLMFTESEVIIGTMLILMREHGVPSMPVHDSLIVPGHKAALATGLLSQQFLKVTGTKPRLDVNDPWDF